MIQATLLCSCLALLAPGAPAEPGEGAPPIAVGDNCASCGKPILFGERCFTCITVEWREARERPCADCGKEILFGTRCAACSYAAVRAKLAHPCAGCEKEILIGARCSACSASYLDEALRGVYGRGVDLAPEVRARLGALLPGGSPSASDEERARAAEEELVAEERGLARYAASAAAWAKEKGVVLGKGVADLEAGRRAAQAVGAALEVATSVEDTKKSIAYAGVRRVARIPVHTELGWTTLEDLARFALIQRAPALEGTDLAEDPAVVIAALVVADHLHFLLDLKLVATPDGPVSIVEALQEASGADPEVAVACVTVLEAVRKLRRGEDVTRALRDLSRGLEMLSPEAAATAEEDEGEVVPEDPLASG